MIVLFTDFGLEGPYVGQMVAVLRREAPAVPVINLFADAPSCDPRAAAYLLAAYCAEFPPGTVFLCVVDPGVGGPRAPLVVEVDGRWFVGPDNGLFNVVAMRGNAVRCWEITWRPQRLSATFHGRDLFAPVAARVARGEAPPGTPRDGARCYDAAWPADRAAVIYLDRFGNALTGLRAAALAPDLQLVVRGCAIARARTFADVAPGRTLWYENANGLAEIAVNQGSAREALGLRIGDPVDLSPS